MSTAGRIEQIPVSKLRLDPENPRLPEERSGGSQEQLAQFIALAYDALSVALSVAEHGYFESEPLIAIEDGSNFLVVEGNRRLTALLGLIDPAVREKFGSSKLWEAAANEAERNGNVPESVPVLVVEDRKSVAPIIGYRHISGILPWEAFAKARFIASLVEGEGLGFEEVGEFVGEKKGAVASAYRNFAILRQARNSGVIPTSGVEHEFGVFTAAMGRVPLRSFVEAPAPGQVVSGEDPIPVDKLPELRQLLVWLGGDSDGNGQAISDSRQLDGLAQVIGHPIGLEALQSTNDLDAALEAMNQSDVDPRRQVLNRLTSARSSLRLALAQIEAVPQEDVDVLRVISDCVLALESIRAYLP